MSCLYLKYARNANNNYNQPPVYALQLDNSSWAVWS